MNPIPRKMAEKHVEIKTLFYRTMRFVSGAQDKSDADTVCTACTVFKQKYPANDAGFGQRILSGQAGCGLFGPQDLDHQGVNAGIAPSAAQIQFAAGS